MFLYCFTLTTLASRAHGVREADNGYRDLFDRVEQLESSNAKMSEKVTHLVNENIKLRKQQSRMASGIRNFAEICSAGDKAISKQIKVLEQYVSNHKNTTVKSDTNAAELAAFHADFEQLQAFVLDELIYNGNRTVSDSKGKPIAIETMSDWINIVDEQLTRQEKLFNYDMANQMFVTDEIHKLKMRLEAVEQSFASKMENHTEHVKALSNDFQLMSSEWKHLNDTIQEVSDHMKGFCF